MLKKLYNGISETRLVGPVMKWLAHYVGGLIRHAEEHHIFLMSGGLAFSLFTCIIPLLFVIFAVLGKLFQEPAISGEVSAFIDRAIPYPEYADRLKSLVFSRMDELVDYRNIAGAIGIVGLFFAASGLFSSMRTALNSAFRMTANESLLLGKLRDLILMLFVVVYFIVSTTFLPGLQLTQRLSEKITILNGLGLDLPAFAFGLLSLVLIFVSFYIVYFFLPRYRPPVKVVFVGAAWAAVLWYLAHQAFSFYIVHMVTLKRIYGAYFFFIAVAFWIYYTALVFILGAEIGQLYRERADELARAKTA